MPFNIVQGNGGVYISVKVKTRSKRSSVEIGSESLTLNVKSPPLEGRANEEIIRLIREFFDVPRSQIKITKGSQSKRKTVFIEGFSADAAASFLALSSKSRK